MHARRKADKAGRWRWAIRWNMSFSTSLRRARLVDFMAPSALPVESWVPLWSGEIVPRVSPNVRVGGSRAGSRMEGTFRVHDHHRGRARMTVRGACSFHPVWALEDELLLWEGTLQHHCHSSRPSFKTSSVSQGEDSTIRTIFL
jgi:hypothetical protein